MDYSGFTNIELDYKLRFNNSIYGLEDAMTMNGYLQLGWNKSCVDVKVGEYSIIPWTKCNWSGACVKYCTVLTDLDIYTGFISTQL